jgi:hypothetical protein
VNAVMNLLVPEKVESFLTLGVSIGLSSILLHV